MTDQFRKFERAELDWPSTFNADPDGWRFLTNLEKTEKEIVLRAIAETGQAVEWRDAPHEPSRGAHIVGSVWSREPGRDCSRFWAAYRRIKEEGKPR